MKLRLSLTTSVLALALLLSACGSGNGVRDDGGAMPPGGMAPGSNSSTTASSPSASEEFGFYDMDAAPEAPSEDRGDSASQTNAALDSAQVKMIYRGSLYVETMSFDQAATELDSLVTYLGGYFEGSRICKY